MTVIGTATLRLLGDTAQFEKELQGASAELAKTGKMMQNAGKKLTVGLTVPLALAGGAASKFALDFQAGMANVASLMPGSTARVMELSEAVKDMSIETGKGLGDLTDGLYNVVSAFGDTAETAEILRINALAAAGGLAETGQAIDLTSGITKAYGDTTAEAVQSAADLALLTVRLGQTTFPELAASMGRVTPLAAALAVSQEELFGTMATFTGVTGKAAEVSTQLRGVLQALMAPTADMTTLFGDLNVESGKALIEQRGMQGAIEAIVQAAEDSGTPLQKFIGSIEGQTLALAATGGQAEVYTQKTLAMADAAGSVTDAVAEQTEGVNKSGFALAQAKAEMAVAAVELGQNLLPAVASVSKAVANLTSVFTKLSPGVQTTVVVFGGLVAALGPVLMMIGNVQKAIALLTPAFTALGPAIAAIATPVVLAVAAFAALVLAGRAVYQHWDVLKFEAAQLWERIKSVFKGGVDFVKNILGGFVDGVVDRFAWMANVLVGNSVVPDMMKLIGKEFGGLDKLMVAPADEAAAAVTKAFESIANPKGVKGINYAVSIDASELYGAVIAATGSAAVAFDALSDKVAPTAEMFLLLQDEIAAQGVAGRSYANTVRDLRKASVELDGDLRTASGSAALLGTEALTVGNDLVTMSAQGQEGINRQVAALKDSEFSLKMHKAASDIMATASDQASMAFANMQRTVGGLIGDFTPLGMLATVLGSALEALQPAFDALKAPLKILGVILASALMPILKALFPVIKFLSVAASYVVEGFLWLAGITLKVTGWLMNAIGTFVYGLGKILSKIPLIGSIFKPMKNAGKAMMEGGQAQMDAGEGMLEAIDDVKAGREEIRALEWPEEAVEAASAQTAATEGTTEAVGETTGAVQAMGGGLAEIAGNILDGVLTLRDIMNEGVGYLSMMAATPGVFDPMASRLSPALPEGALGSISSGGGTQIDVAPGAVVISSSGENPEQDGRDAARGFMDELSGERFNRTRRLITRSGRIERE